MCVAAAAGVCQTVRCAVTHKKNFEVEKIKFRKFIRLETALISTVTISKYPVIAFMIIF